MSVFSVLDWPSHLKSVIYSYPCVKCGIVLRQRIYSVDLEGDMKNSVLWFHMHCVLRIVILCIVPALPSQFNGPIVFVQPRADIPPWPLHLDAVLVWLVQEKLVTWIHLLFHSLSYLLKSLCTELLIPLFSMCQKIRQKANWRTLYLNKVLILLKVRDYFRYFNQLGTFCSI